MNYNNLNRWYIGSCIFFIGFAMICYLWQKYDIASFEEQILSPKPINSQGNKSKLKKEKVYKSSLNDDRIVEKNNFVEKKFKTMHDESGFEKKSIKMNFTKEEYPNTESDLDFSNKNVELRISPFGFGPYPNIPDGFPFEDPWTSVINLTDKEAKNFELIHRVHIKLWNEGKRPEGLSYENGVIYATYPNTIYVTWDYDENEEGTIERYPSEVTSGTLTDEANALLDEGIIPPDVIVYDHNEVGIDPYTYLELK